MPVDQKRILALALANLEDEKSRIDAEIAELRAQINEKHAARKGKVRATQARKAVTSRARTSKQKAETSAAMKKLWAKVHKAGFTNIKDYKASLSNA